MLFKKELENISKLEDKSVIHVFVAQKYIWRGK